MRSLFRICLAAVLLWSTGTASLAGDSGWHALPNAPVAGRHDDIYFSSPQVGWAVSSSGKIHRTTDGGDSWVQQLQISGYFRSVYFADEQRGWAGTLGGETLLYATSNGGTSWHQVTNLPDPGPEAICGISGFGADLIVATGAYHAPAKFTRSTDGGATWTIKDMSAHARNLVDCHFFSADSGFVVGGSPAPTESQAYPVILFTADGGETWETRFTGTVRNGYGWKIFFETPKNGWVSTYNLSNAQVFKTTDGGATWEEQHVPGNDSLEGIGFASPTLGWVDGWGLASQTVDGGDTWAQVDLEDNNNNRFVMFGNSVGFAAGSTIYKYDPATSSAPAPPLTAETLAASDPLQLKSYPNPSGGRTTIEFLIAEASPVTVRIYSALGRHIDTIVTDEMMPSGRRTVLWSATDAGGNDLPSGRYLYRVDAGGEASSRILTLVR